MAFADKIKIKESVDSKRIQDEFAERFRYLSGFDYPPKDSAEWVIVLKRAGFSELRIEQFLHSIGVEGFDVGDLPSIYTSAGAGDFPVFSAMLFEGLEKWSSEQPESEEVSSPKKIKPTPETLRIIRSWEAGKGIGDVTEENNCSAAVARKVRSNLKRNMYEI